MGTHPTALYTGRIYPGLRPFDVNDAVLFFGRDEQTDELLRRLDDTRFLAVVGLSGSGKSSLVRAGLLPALHRGHLTGAGARWQVSILRPGSDPLQALARVLNETLGERDDRLAMLRSGRLGLLDTSRQGRNADENLLLVVDQFEEIFRFQDSYRQRASEAADFVELLLAAAREYEPAYRVYVVMTLRSDYLGECARFRGLPEALNESQYLVPRMAREQLREAIGGPAALGGVALSKELQEELLERTGDDPDQLPVLQHLLMRMWEIRESDGAGFSIGHDQYKSVGGWDKALNSHADKVWKALGDRRDLAKRMLQRLTERAEGRGEVRRPTILRELADVSTASVEDVRKVVEHFRSPECNFLTSPDSSLTEDSVIDITHESLIRNWKKLNKWTIEEARDRDDYLYFSKRMERGGDPLTGTDLALALKWREREHGPEWAARYGGNFAAVIAFIERSLNDQEEREREEQNRKRQKELEERRFQELGSARRLQKILATVAAVFLMLLLLVTVFYRRAEKAGLESKSRELAAFSAASLSDDPEKSILLGMRAVNATQPPVPAAEQALHQAILSSQVRVTLRGHTNSVNGVAFSPDGKRLATASADHTAKVWDTESGKELFTLRGHTNSVNGVAFSPDGKRLATASADQTAKVWDAESGKELFTLRGHSSSVNDVAFSPDGKRLATASQDHTAKVWDTESGKELFTLRGHTNSVNGVAFSPDGKRLATASEDQTAKVWDAESGKELFTLRDSGPVYSVAFSPDGKRLATASKAFSPDGKRLATASADDTAKVWDAESGKELFTLRGHSSSFFDVAFSPDGKRLATASEDQTAKVWDAESGKELLTLRGHTNSVNGVAFSPDGKRLATASQDQTAKVWDAESGQELLTLRGQSDPVYSVAFSPDGKRLATASQDQTAKVWDAESGQELLTLRGQELLPLRGQGAVSSVAFSSDGKRLATASADDTAKVWDAESGKELLTLRGQSDFVFGVAFSPDGKRLATASADHTAKVWDAESGKELVTLRGHSDFVFGVAFSPDGKRLATASRDHTAKVWDAESGKELFTLRGHTNSVNGVAFSPDGKRLATASVDQTAKVWDTESGKELLTLRGHTNSVNGVAFSPDGKRLATASVDQTAKVWDAGNGKELLTLRGHTNSVNGVAFSPDGKRLATASRDGTVQVYVLELRELLNLARSRITRPFTPEECQLYFQSPTCPPLP
jgi:WD40 repeat protein